jgi:hypothetical protein
MAGDYYSSQRIVLPTGSKAPPHAHVTEVAPIEKKFIDCGGTFRTDSVCRLQTWFADDTNHRLTAGKLLAILDKSASFLKSDGLEVEVEHETGRGELRSVTGKPGTVMTGKRRCLYQRFITQK